MPDCARVPEAVVCALYDISRDTAWVRVKAGLIPAPIKQGNTTRWVVGDLRAALAR
ncbi:transcriptional regulator [Aquabacterium soli]|uniref:Transcriptional regulator n=1 Tax=Aquabacterium soli TaxID=2493092 RepID=A0A3R8T0K6_9BURK|nr:transcriptional regulator [Aquabacterium soli]